MDVSLNPSTTCAAPITISAQDLSEASPDLWKQNALVLMYFLSVLAHVYTQPCILLPCSDQYSDG